MVKKLFSLLALVFSLTVLWTSPCFAQYEKLDDTSILRNIYPTQSLVINSDVPDLPGRRFQVGNNEAHKAAVLNRFYGKFTQADNQEMLVMVGIDTGEDSSAPLPTAIYAFLFQLDKNGMPKLMARSNALQSKISPFGTKYWRPVVATDIDFDKIDDLIMLEGDSRTGAEHYRIFHWQDKDFISVEDHPMMALLDFYAHLDAAVRQGLTGETENPGNAQLETAIEKLSTKLQGQQSVDSLRRRLQDARGVRVEGLKLMIGGKTSALIRLQYCLTGKEEREFEGDYQIRKFNDKWQLDSERLKALIR